MKLTESQYISLFYSTKVQLKFTVYLYTIQLVN